MPRVQKNGGGGRGEGTREETSRTNIHDRVTTISLLLLLLLISLLKHLVNSLIYGSNDPKKWYYYHTVDI